MKKIERRLEENQNLQGIKKIPKTAPSQFRGSRKELEGSKIENKLLIIIKPTLNLATLHLQEVAAGEKENERRKSELKIL